MRQLKITHSKLKPLSKPIEKIDIPIGENLLTKSQELELIKLAKEGDQEAKDKIIKDNERFVISLAKQYQGKGLSLEELINEGNKAILLALDKFDESKGYKFYAYAVWWIRQSMINAIEEKKEGRK